MEGFPSDFQAVQAASDKALETLHTVVAWLHQEGFYNAEHALLGEVESRYPDHLQPCANSPAVPHVSPHPKDTSVNLNASAGSAELPGPGDVPSSAERCVPPPPLQQQLSSSDLFSILHIHFSHLSLI